jgi:uncharacterized protein (TIGR02996 family)
MTALDRERAAFLYAICSNPADDVSRLVYADWLEEHGEGEQARFIRSHVLRLRGSHSLCQPKWFRKYQCLIHANVWITTSDVCVLVKRSRYIDNVTVNRGFISSIQVTPKNFGKYAPLFAKHPITSVILLGKSPSDIDTPSPRYSGLFYGREREVDTDCSDTIDGPIFDLISGGELLYFAGHPVRRFKSFEDAESALSSACVAYGRSLANLPPLTAPATLPVSP